MVRNFLQVSMSNGSEKFMIWNSDIQCFEEHNDKDIWSTWSELKEDLYGGDEVINEYEESIPIYIKNLNQPIKIVKEVKKDNIFYSVSFWFFLLLMGTALWQGAIKPTLGYFGVIEYKSKTLLRYESFLNKVSDCEEKKKLFEGNHKYPIFHLFQCKNGEEVLWSHKIEVIRKANDSKWILE